MKRTVINNLLLIGLCFMANTSFSQYNQRCFIAQFESGTTQAEIDALLNPFNLYIEEGPTTDYINQFALVCIDSILGLPDSLYINPNGEVDINGVILNVAGVDDDNDNILGTTGLDFDMDPLTVPSGSPSRHARHPLTECGLNSFSINTIIGHKQRKIGMLDTGVKTNASSGLDAFFDPYDLGWNFVEDTPYPSDDNGHGTHMTSSITLNTPDEFSSVLEVKAFKTHDINGVSSLWRLIQGIERAIQVGAEIANMSNSYGSSYEHRFSNAPLKIAIEEALELGGILFVTSAGNNGWNNDDPNGSANYPASFNNDNILAVTAVGCNYIRPTWANYGAFSVDVGAPGVDIWGLDHNLEYIKMSGSSSAAALTSRVAAMFATQQTVFSYKEIKCAIINGARISEFGNNGTLSKGYLDAGLAQSVFDGEAPCGTVSTPSSSANARSTDNALNASIQNGSILTIDSDKEQVAQVRVFNLLGQTLSAKEIRLQKGQNNYTLEIPNYSEVGTYICHLQYGTESQTIKFVR